MMTEWAVKIGGGLSAALGVAHCLFYRGFGWKEEFNKINLVSAKVLYTIHIFLMPVFFFYAYLSFFFSKELAGGTPLGLALTLFYSLFWLARGIWQVVYFRPSGIKATAKLLLLHYTLIIYFFLLWCAYSYPLAKFF